MLATLVRNASRSALAPRAPFAAAGAQRSIYVEVRDNQDPERAASRLQQIMANDGTMKTLARKRFHEKKWQKRKRKAEESNIRHANRRIGSMIDFILRRKKSGF